MPKASRTTASDRSSSRATKGTSRTSARYTVGFERYTADADLAPLFAGLPDDRCQCPHMGYVSRAR